MYKLLTTLLGPHANDTPWTTTDCNASSSAHRAQLLVDLDQPDAHMSPGGPGARGADYRGLDEVKLAVQHATGLQHSVGGEASCRRKKLVITQRKRHSPPIAHIVAPIKSSDTVSQGVEDAKLCQAINQSTGWPLAVTPCPTPYACGRHDSNVARHGQAGGPLHAL